MSYDFELFRTPRGADPAAAYKGHAEERRERLRGDRFSDIDPVKEQIKHLLAEALTARHPTFQIFRWDYPRISKAKSIDEDEARRRYRDLQLTDDAGLQITLFDDSAAATISFWPNPENTLRRAWECLRILESKGNFSAYDSQIGKVLNLDTDFDVVLRALGTMTRTTDQTLRNPRSGSR